MACAEIRVINTDLYLSGIRDEKKYLMHFCVREERRNV